MKVGEFLAKRLKQLGCDQTFGVPGDCERTPARGLASRAPRPFQDTSALTLARARAPLPPSHPPRADVLGLCDQLIEAGVEWVGCSNELNAGYAADGYARVSGIGCATVTYGVGGLSLINACAGAFAESVPLVVICGGPNLEAYNAESVVKTHHSIPGDMCAQLKAYQGVTAAAPLINDPGSAAKVIDKVPRAPPALPLHPRPCARTARLTICTSARPLAAPLRPLVRRSRRACATAARSTSRSRSTSRRPSARTRRSASTRRRPARGSSARCTTRSSARPPSRPRPSSSSARAALPSWPGSRSAASMRSPPCAAWRACSGCPSPRLATVRAGRAPPARRHVGSRRQWRAPLKQPELCGSLRRAHPPLPGACEPTHHPTLAPLARSSLDADSTARRQDGRRRGRHALGGRLPGAALEGRGEGLHRG